MSKYNAVYTSVWDNDIEINARCYVRKDGLISRMGGNNAIDGIEEDICQLTNEFVTLDSDGKDYPVCKKDEYNGNGYYYK